MEEKIKVIVDEELETARGKIFTRIQGIFKDGNQTSSAPRSLRLEFVNGISKEIFTGEEITGEGEISIRVVLVDSSTGKTIGFGPEASARVEIVLLKEEFDAYEWTVEEFNENIVRAKKGKKPFQGNTRPKLQCGVVVLENIKLKHSTSKTKFRLGARAVDAMDGVLVKEAKTECFAVKDYRNKRFNKHKMPFLSDGVSLLTFIRYGGEIEKRLGSVGINTVEDFLIRLLVDPEGLKKIVNLPAKKWEKIAQNARNCQHDKMMFCYKNPQHKTGVVFNILGHVLGLYCENQLLPSETLSEDLKIIAQELQASACEHWEDTQRLDDDNLLEQYFSDLSTFVSDPLDLSYPRGYYSPLNDSDMAYIYDNFLHQDGEMSNAADEHMPAACGVMLVESHEAFEIVKASKRWKRLFCVSRWISTRKLVSLGDNHSPKRQKVC